MSEDPFVRLLNLAGFKSYEHALNVEVDQRVKAMRFTVSPSGESIMVEVDMEEPYV